MKRRDWSTAVLVLKAVVVFLAIVGASLFIAWWVNT